MPANSKSPADAIEAKELKKLVLKTIKALPKKERMVTVLFYINGYSHQEIARFLNLPLTTVNHRLRSSRKHLKEKMTDMMKDGLLEAASYEGSPSQEDSPIAVDASPESKDSAEEQVITMVKATLHEEAPSRDEAFATAVSICNAAQAGEIERLRAILEG
jgi:DNA-directed RNA polymerase specialized sigma subunit